MIDIHLDFELKNNAFNSLNYFHIDEFIQEYGIDTFPNKYINDNEYIIEIEKGVKRKLTNKQKMFIINKGTNIIYSDDSENLVAYYIKLSLSDGFPIKIKDIFSFDLNGYIADTVIKKNFTPTYSELYGKKFIDVWLRLKRRGFEVRRVIH